MKDTNRKVLASSIVTAIIVWFISWFVFSPSINTQPIVETVKDSNGKWFYVVSIDDEQWAAKYVTNPGWGEDWVNLKTGEACFKHRNGMPFVFDTFDLQKIVDEWRQTENHRRIKDIVNSIKGD